MNKMVLMMLAMTIGFLSCKSPDDQSADRQSYSTENHIFLKGEKIENDNFHGTAWLKTLVEGDSVNHIGVGSVTFEPGARTKWHLHPDGQIILAISGTGYYQEQGSPKRILRKGDVAKCPPDIPHWHGASSEATFVQVAITSRLKGPAEWLDAVTDEEYHLGEE